MSDDTPPNETSGDDAARPALAPRDFVQKKLWEPIVRLAERVPGGPIILALVVSLAIGIPVLAGLWSAVRLAPTPDVAASGPREEAAAFEPSDDAASLQAVPFGLSPNEIRAKYRSLNGRWLEQEEFDASIAGQEVVWSGFVHLVEGKRGLQSNEILLMLSTEELSIRELFFARAYESDFEQEWPDTRTRLYQLRDGDQVRIAGALTSGAENPSLRMTSLEFLAPSRGDRYELLAECKKDPDCDAPPPY